ncbi:uncharacterized protein [Populus alba]|uniref:uncharacterized protein n=1 Tax=Populus alba TaxID=43335 RepID=UPI001588C999|nr:zinc finger MYM-type protein 1-like [Populus alba]
MKLEEVISKCQPKLAEYPRTESGRQYRRFQYTWFDQFPWLEYSPSKDAIFCFSCFIFENKVPRHLTFTTEGFRSWKRVNDGVRCALLMHVGSPTSPHNNAVKSAGDLMKVSRHIDKVLNAQTVEEVQKNRLRLMTTIESVRWLSLQACTFRGHDESSTSNNRGNFLEMIRLMGRLNVDIDDVVLEKAPKNAKYTSPTIQKEILHILANKVRKKICEEVRDAKFCILVDEAKDASNKEQMAIVLRFVDIQGQGYDGASNMCGAWNGLQALFLRDCPYAYYVHCFAHRLQLALVATAGNEISIWLFFSKLTTIINLICASPKHHIELHYAQAIEIAHMVATGERETGRGANQIGNLHQSGTTRWSSHFDSICSLIDMYGATITVLESMVQEGSSNSIRGEAGGCLIVMKSFEFIFILYLMHKIMGITDLLCRALQQKSLDILNAMDLVSTTKALLQTLRDAKFDLLLENVQFVCTKYEIDIPHMNASYKKATGRSCQQQGSVTVYQHYHYDIFNSTIDFQLEELNSRFSDEIVELLVLSSALEPKDNFKSFKVDAIYKLAEKFYPEDFNE